MRMHADRAATAGATVTILEAGHDAMVTHAPALAEVLASAATGTPR
jgi:hypothetical protein